MWNGNVIAVGAFFLAACIVSVGGCESGAVSSTADMPARGAQKIRGPDGRYQVDPERRRVWFLTHEGVFVYDASRKERIEVSLPGWVSMDPFYGCLPDLVLGPGGEAVVTSNSLPTLWRIDPDTLAVSVHPLLLDADRDKDVGFSGLAYSPQHGAFLAASYIHGSLWKIDPQFTTAHKISLSTPIREACGLAVRSRTSRQALRWLIDLCVHTPHGGWALVFAPDWRSAHVSAAPCPDRPWPLDAGEAKGT